MTLHTIIKECRKRLETLQHKSNLLHAEYSSFLGLHSEDDFFYNIDVIEQDRNFNRKISPVDNEIRKLRSIIYEYEKGNS